jgi:DNA-binding NarL/FixJ family response regulator
LNSPLQEILIADDHLMILDGIRSIVREEWPSMQCHLAKDFREVLLALDARGNGNAFDAIVLDLRMPGMRGADSVAEVSRRALGSPVIVCTGLDDPSLLNRLKATGVFSIVQKSSGSGGLLQSLGAALNAVRPRVGIKVANPKNLSSGHEIHWDGGSAMLTSRQRDILKLLHLGKPNKIIADEMGIGLGTVKSHLHALYAIMGVTSRSEAIVKSKRWMI